MIREYRYPPMTLGEILSNLQPRYDGFEVLISPAWARLVPKGLHSYRGYYEQLAIDYTTDFHHCLLQGHFRQMLEKAIGTTFIGYKGGSYLMDRDTSVWVSLYSLTSGRMVSRVHTKKTRDMTIIETESDE